MDEPKASDRLVMGQGHTAAGESGRDVVLAASRKLTGAVRPGAVLLAWIMLCQSPALGQQAKPIRIPPEPLAKLHPKLAWIERDGVLAAWGHAVDDTEAYLRKLKTSGFNLVIYGFTGSIGRQEHKQKFLENVVRCATAADRAGIALMIGRQYGTNHADPYRRFRPMFGDLHKRSGCPLDREYLQRHMFQYVPEILEIDRRADCRIDGFHMDFEMYGSDDTYYGSPCVCDDCFRRYLRRTRPSADQLFQTIQPGSRGSWLKSKSLAGHYAAWFELRIGRQYEELQRQAHRRKPEFLFSYAPFFRWLPGLTRGLGTPQVPCLVFSELEYKTGVTDAALRMKDAIRARGFPGIYLPGLWLQWHRPDAVARSALRGLVGGDGMWLWDATGLWRYPERDNPKAYGTYGRAKNTSAEDYSRAIQAARKQAAEGRGNPNATIPRPMPDRPAPPAVNVPRRRGPVRIDGDIGEAAWSKAAIMGPLVQWNGTAAGNKTIARATWDDRFLYIAFECGLAGSEKPSVPVRGRDNAILWRSEGVEVFIDANLDRLTYVQLVITAAGDVLDTSVALAPGEFAFGGASWDAGAQVATAAGDGGWSAELAIPFASLGIRPKAGGRIGINCCRNDRQNGQSLCWSPTFGGFHLPGRFGTVQLTD